MIKYTDVIYDEKPKEITVDDTVVYVIKSCEEVEIKDELIGASYIKYKCDVEEYSTSEYIDILHKSTALLNSQMDDAQIALTEVFEMMLSMLG